MNHPERLGKYPITGVIGEGAMGVVYKAFDPVIERPVAIKTIHRSLSGPDGSDSSYAARFRNEAQAVGRLSHPGIVAIYEYGEDADTAFIAMEYVEGRTLSQLLATTPLPNEPTVVRVMEQLLDALECAHRAGVWHRDIKPANIIVTARGQLKITDFGIARIETNALTLVTSIIGTPGYIAPEQYIGLPLDHRIDVFAAGVLLYRMLTGNSPFAGTPEAVMYKTVNESPEPPSVVTSGRRSAHFDGLVAKALAKKPEDRYVSAAAFRQALLHAVAESPASAEAPTPLPPAPAPLSVPAPRTHPRTPPTATPTLSTTPPATDPHGPLPSGAIGHALRVLTAHMGPIARIVVKKAALQARSVDEFHTLIVEEAAEGSERKRLLKRLRSTA
ncbi:MAG TPA: serine/threonine-protein kinase [Albitalea sp.]|uniref:serine/threonine-protein kinase n=1 Tax=Piscinibacter sp. TaxID=1903157 RepID=UPI002ED39681